MSTVTKRIYLSPPHMSGNEKKYINDAFEQNWIAPLGPNVDAFEKVLADYCGVKHAAALSSGTSAIHLALIILGIKPGDEVIASSFTFSATINPIIYQGAIPVLIDSEPDSWNMDPELLEKAIQDRIKKGKKPAAIIPVHLYGMPANMEKIMQIASHYDIPVVEDAAEALGSKFNHKALGSFGKMAALSFNGNKIITTSGGGALLSDDAKMIEKARFLATQARDKALWYQHTHIGFNYRMSNLLAGVGRGQMEVIDDRVKVRREHFQFYQQNLKDQKGISLVNEPDGCFSNRWLTTVLIDPAFIKKSWEQVQFEMEKENIETRPLWKPMHLQPVFSDCPAYINGVSESLFKRGLCLPSGSAMTSDDLHKVVSLFLKAIHNH